MKLARNPGRKGVAALLATLAVLASLVATASPAAAAVTAPEATVSKSAMYRGEEFTVEFGPVLCDGVAAPETISVGVAGQGQGQIVANQDVSKTFTVPMHAPLTVNSVVGIVYTGPCTGQIIHFVTFDVHPQVVDIDVETGSSTYRPGDTATFTATVTAPHGGTPTGTVTFVDDDQPLGDAPIEDGVAVLHGVPVGDVRWHHVVARISGSAWYENSVSKAMYEVAPIPLTLDVTGPTTIAPATTADYVVTPTSSEGTRLIDDLTATVDGDPVTVDASSGGGSTASVAVDTTELSVGDHTLTVSVPARGAFAAASTDTTFTVSRADAALTVTAPESIRYGDPFDVTVTAASSVDRPFDGAVQVHLDGHLLGAVNLDASGSGALAVAAERSADFQRGTYSLSADYDGGSNHEIAHGTSDFEVVAQPTAVDFSLDAIEAGGTTTATIDVTAAQGAPYGYVSVSIDGGPDLGLVYLVSGSATITFATPAAGEHEVTVTYWGTGGTTFAFGETTRTVLFTVAATDTVADVTVSPSTSASDPSDLYVEVCTTIVNPACRSPWAAAPSSGSSSSTTARPTRSSPPPRCPRVAASASA